MKVCIKATEANPAVHSSFPEGWGQIKFTYDRLLNREAPLIEYKWRRHAHRSSECEVIEAAKRV